ncbi:hypothetical protein QR680_018756 [Steinernema hermaphroditum]|uniref:Uncharacterized protein n=1 Tax=Steinernema hermaphroditum TaxID=289476 RepID=A0AA39HIX4_9BILA|nr:hypothetical protein QR680_018756 [Steinernema hermaphroditum]
MVAKGERKIKIARTPQVREAVRKMIKRNPDRSIMKLAKKYKIGYASMHKLVTEDLHLKSYKISRGHLLTDAKKAERLQKCKKLRAESRGSELAGFKPDGLRDLVHSGGKGLPKKTRHSGRPEARSPGRLGRNQRGNTRGDR